LYGHAYRAPSSAEADISSSFYVRNPTVRPERSQTMELDVERRIGSPLLVGASIYEYRLRDLINEVEVGNTGTVKFENIEASKAAGLELKVDALPNGPVSGHLSYAFQRTTTDASGEPLTNSPQQIAQVALTSTGWQGLRPAAEVRYESGRRTISGPSTPAFTRTDLNLGYVPATVPALAWLRGAEVSLRVTNLFDVSYATPGGIEHRQSAIRQDGRAFLFRFDWQL
jgi:outer membrane cobalamin receptor